MKPSIALAYQRHQRLWGEIAGEISPGDLAHEHLHVLRVYRWALELAPEAGADPDLAGAAALVHDLVNVPKEAAHRSQGGELSAVASTPYLSAAGYTDAEAAQIREAVRTCSWSRGLAPEGPVGVVLQDADRLDAIGAIGIARTFTTAQAMAGRGADLALYSTDDPLTHGGRDPEDRRFAVDHFMVKLLRLADTMHLPSARAEAERRHRTMLAFLEAFAREAR